MRSSIVALGVALATGALIYGSSRVPARSIEPLAAVPGVTPPPAPAPLDPDPRPSPPVASPFRAPRVPSARSIAAHVKAAAARHGLPESLVSAVVSVESEFNPRAVSRRGALGLMQLMPGTAALLGVRDAFDPEQNVDGGTRYLRDLMDRFDNDVTLALAAYNAGAQAVIRHGGVPPYPETRAFVARVLGRVGRVAMPAVALAEPSSPPPVAPRVRFARLTGDRVRRETDVVQVSLDAVALRTEPAPVPAPVPARPAAPEPVPVAAVSAPAMNRVESP
jgi:hypothetical protein